MMHHCCSSQENMVGPCSCGIFHSQNNAFSMYSKSYYDEQQTHDMYYSTYASASVDCTLSLGTPSTRLSEDDERRASRRDNGSCVSNYCWDFLHASAAPHKISRGSGNNHSDNNNHSSAGNDPLLARRCANCDTTSTPLWRNGPRGPKSLCNACGIRFKKEERRASAANASMNNASVSMGSMKQQAWTYNHSQAQKMPCYSPAYGNEFRFIEDSNGNSDTTTYPYLSWRLNVADRATSLVHDFTR